MNVWRVVTTLTLLTLVVWTTVPPATATTVASSPSGEIAPHTPGTPSRSAGATNAPETIHVTHHLALTPERPGEITVRTAVAAPDSVVNTTVYVPQDANVTATDGFAKVNDTAYLTDDANASVTYRLPVNQSRSGMGPEGDSADGEYVFVDAGEWALVSRPGVALRWYASRNVSVNRSLAVDGEGVAGTTMAFLGPHRTVTRTAHGQQFDLVVPEAASMAESPSAVLDSLANASGELRVGDRDDHVFAIAAPATVSWGVAGLQMGDADFWVRADQRLDEANNVWLHEYVHARQDYTPSSETRWTIEGSADYYASLLALEQGRISFEQFREKLREGRDSTVSDAVLSNPDDWTGYANYYKGALVAGDLDRRVRLASDGERTFESVWRSMNSHDGKNVSQSTFLGSVADAGNESVRTEVDRFTTTSDTPSLWTRQAHLAAFGSDIGSVAYRFDGPLVVNGSYRNATLNGSTVRIVPGERISATALAENADTSERAYNLSIWLDGELLDSETGRLAGGETATLSANRTFDRRGEYALTTGSDTVTVSVVDPANVSVAAVSLNRTRLSRPGIVGVTVAIQNGKSIPADDTLEMAVDGRVVTNRTVRLAPGTVARVTVPVRVDGVGNHTVGVAGGLTKNVTVERAATTTDRPATGTVTETTSNVTVTVELDGTPVETAGSATTDETATATSGPGFGVAATLVALLGFVLALRRRTD